MEFDVAPYLISPSRELPTPVLVAVRRGLAYLNCNAQQACAAAGMEAPLEDWPGSKLDTRSGGAYGLLTAEPIVGLLATVGMRPVDGTGVRVIVEAIALFLTADQSKRAPELASALASGCRTLRRWCEQGSSPRIADNEPVLDGLKRLQDDNLSDVLSLVRMFDYLAKVRSPRAGGSRTRCKAPDRAAARDPAPSGTPQHPTRPSKRSRDAQRRCAGRATAKRRSQQELLFTRPNHAHRLDLDRISKWMAASRKQWDGSHAVVAAVLISGQPARDLVNWTTATTPDEHPHAPTAFVLEPPSLRIRDFTTPRLPGDGSKEDVRHIHLPLNDIYGRAVLLAHAKGRAGESLFEASDLQGAKEALRKLEGGPPILLESLHRVIRDLLRATSGGRTARHYILGEGEHSPLPAPLYYASIPPDHLSQCYVTSLDRVGYVRDKRTAVSPNPHLIGSKRTPDATDWKDWISGLVRNLEDKPRGRPTLQKVINFHHLYTAYTISLLFAATGVRPTAHGLASLEPVIGADLLVADKRRDKAAARVVTLCPKAHAQWNAYTRHHRWISRFIGQTDLPRWFFIEAERPVAATPRSWIKHSRTTHVENAHRHHLASTLLRLGWQGHRVQFLLGHADAGMEPGHNWNSAFPRLTADEITALEGIVTEDGWKAIEGLGHG